MNVPYIFSFETDELLVHREDNDLIPEWCSYPMSFAQQRELFGLDHALIFSQSFNYRPFYVELVQAVTEYPLSYSLEITERQLFLCFMLEGEVRVSTADNRPIIVNRAHTFMMCYFSPGKYIVRPNNGKYIALTVSILPEWLESISSGFHNLQHILSRFKAEIKPFDTMCIFRIDKKIQRWLYKIYSYSQANRGALDGNLRKYISYVLEYYDRVLSSDHDNIACKAKSYLDEHYRDSELSVRLVAGQFNVTERTLLNHFKRQYSMGVHDYYSDLRISDALTLMERYGMPIKEVYMEVGYSDESSFRYALGRYQNGYR